MPQLTAAPPARTALVTGANRGIGRLIALGLADAGLVVGLLGRSEPGLAEVAAEIQDRGGRAGVARADVTVFAEVQDAVRQLEGALGGVDLLVNNAGVIETVEVPAWEADPTDWWHVVETDLRGPFHLVRAVVPGMLERGGGRVVGLNSNAGAMDRAVYSAYCAAKAGMFRITGNLHLAGFARGLRAFEISPGHVRTGMTASMPMHRDRTEWTGAPATVALIAAAGRGELDAWSGCFLRAGADTVASLAAAAEELTGKPAEDLTGEPAGEPAGPRDAVPSPARRLGVIRWGPGDPYAG